MGSYIELWLVLLPWFAFILIALIAKKLMEWAKTRRGAAVVFGVLVQMLLPDPQVEKTIETVMVKKRQENKSDEQSED